MTKRIEAKHKIDRRLGENIWGRPKSPVNRREYGPGQHGQRRKGKLSDFGTQLRAKQKLKGYYGDVTEKQFKHCYEEAARMKGDTSQNLIGLLQMMSANPALMQLVNWGNFARQDELQACVQTVGDPGLSPQAWIFKHQHPALGLLRRDQPSRFLDPRPYL